MASDPLHNIFWHALTGPQALVAGGDGGARRYARGYSPIAAFEDPRHPDFDALAAHCDVGEAIYVAGWSGSAPAGWRIDAEGAMLCMVWDGPPAAAAIADDAFIRLGAAHAGAAVALAGLTRPGPFGPRTIELGEYLGSFDGDTLVAMAGERSHALAWREISGVCTHPQYQGRGLAMRLMLALIGRQRQRGETPFLHVMAHNATARELYLRMGFRIHSEPPVRVIVRV